MKEEINGKEINGMHNKISMFSPHLLQRPAESVFSFGDVY